MSEDSPLNNGESLPSEQQFMKISDYSQGKQSYQNQSQVDEYPFDDLQNILGQQQNKNSRNEMILAQKVNELQQKCNKLTKSNSYLTKRIQQLEISIREDAESQIDIDYLDQFCKSVTQQIENYKQELKTYREKQVSIIQKKNKDIQHSNQTIQHLKAQIDEFQFERTELIQANNQLQKNNRNLLNQIENLQRQLQEERASRNYTKRSSRNTSSAFQQEIQAELQNLIEKLMTELEFERSNNKKSKNQMKRMQQEIMELERQLVSKNNKIYQQQMDYLRSNKGSPKNLKSKYLDQNSSSDRFNFNHHDKPDNVKSKSDRNTYSALKSFTIQQMLSGVIQVDEKERYIIASKLISFYLKKIQIKDYTPYNSDKLMISNFNKVNPILISIRKLPSSPYSGQLSIKKLGWNLGVILSSLVADREENDNDNENDDFLTDTVERLLNEQLSSTDQIYNLKSVVDDIIKSYQ